MDQVVLDLVNCSFSFWWIHSKSALTESWNGTSWTEVADLNTARNTGAGFGESSCFIYCGEGTTC